MGTLQSTNRGVRRGAGEVVGRAKSLGVRSRSASKTLGYGRLGPRRDSSIKRSNQVEVESDSGAHYGTFQAI